jgi:hypothetical protein
MNWERNDRISGLPGLGTRAANSPKGTKVCNWHTTGIPTYAAGANWAELGQDGRMPCPRCMERVAAGKVDAATAKSPRKMAEQRPKRPWVQHEKLAKQNEARIRFYRSMIVRGV